jgi:hypothetical protein
MNCSRETVKMGVPPCNHKVSVRGVPERYVAGADTRGRQEGRPYPWSQQVIHETSGLGVFHHEEHEEGLYSIFFLWDLRVMSG